jgi:hypothetical protein
LSAITVVFVFSRASALSIRTSSFVHARGFVFFDILFPLHQCRQRITHHHNSKCPTNQMPLYNEAWIAEMPFA